jgi:thioredoxin-like negative regulator of GroEL
MSGNSRKQQLEEMLAEDPADAFVRYALAMEHVSEGKDDLAAKCLAELIGQSADYVPAYLQLGQALLRIGRRDEAADAFRRGIATARRQNDAHAAEEMQGFLTQIEFNH